jgi:hypothetical protein
MLLAAGSRLTNQTKEFQPTTIQKMDVGFRPIVQPEGKLQYVAIIETGEELIIDDSSDSESESKNHNELYEKGKIYAPLVNSKDKSNEDESNKPDMFSLGNDPIKTFYIGSITVVGLFILYRILTK